MSTIVTRAGKGSPLTHTEVDNNFTNLNTDKLGSSAIGTTVQALLASGTNIKTVNSSSILGSGNLAVGTVTSVGGAGTVNGISLSGTVTSSGNLTLGGTLSNVSLATQVTGNLPVTNLGSGTGASASTFWRGDGSWSSVTATSATNLAGGALGSVPYQLLAGTTLFLAGNTTTTPKFLTSTGVLGVATAPTYTGSTGSGDVVLATSPTLVTPALGTPSSGTVTNLTGTASININGTVGATTASTGAFTTATASTSFGSPVFKATSSAGGALQNSSGTNQLQWGGGGGNNLSVDVAININPANAQVAISPTGTGSVTINPATVGTINNMSVGATTASTGAFTTLSASGVATVSAGSVSAPAITTTGDTNTGIFFPTADTIAFAEGGTEAMRIDSSGNLLVGLTTGSSKFNVLSDNPINIHNAASTNQSNIDFDGAQVLRIRSYHGSGSNITFATNASGGGNTEQARITSTGLMQFNSGYGSVATAYGCRAWVNFNGTGTVAIRASGNVSSITDNGTGDYTVNFTASMPNVNYCAVGTVGDDATTTASVRVTSFNTYAVGSVRMRTLNNNTDDAQDVALVNVSVFR
jgi:hypothetical protein